MTLVGQTLGEFEILEALGQGGMGAVYKARQISLKRLVALKTLQSAVANDEAYIARFQQEAIAAAALNHPNLVQVYSAGESDGLHWFSMEYVEGESARVRLKREGRIEPQEAITIAICVATALQYGWRKASLIHRDIKPDNIFLSRYGEVKLGDLGLAKNAAESKGLTATGHSMGTPYYISPEQAQDSKSVDFRADIYSLGCTLFHLVSGIPPFDGSSTAAILIKHITDPTPSLQAVWPQCSPRLGEVVGKMMHKDPGARQQDYETLIGDLRRAYAMPAAHAAPVGPMPVSAPLARSGSVPAAGEERRGTYVIEADLEASAASEPALAPSVRAESVPAAGDDGKIIAGIEADHAPPVQSAQASGSTPECDTMPAPNRDRPRAPVIEVDHEAPTMSLLVAGAPSQTAPAGTGELRLVTPMEPDAAAPMVSGPMSTPLLVPVRKPTGSEAEPRSLPVREIIVILLVIAASWFYVAHHGKRASMADNEPDGPEDIPNPASVWRDWVFESHRDGYFLYHREFTDLTAGNHTEVVFPQRAATTTTDTFRNGKIRVRCVVLPANSPEQYVKFYVRMVADGRGGFRRYEAYLTRDTIVFALNDSAQGVREITHWSIPPTPEAPIDIVMEIEAKKHTFTVSLDRRVVGTVRDDTLPGAGGFGIDAPAGTMLSMLSFIDLDPAPAPAGSPAPK